MSFSTLGLHDSILKAITEAGYTEPTAVQVATVPLALGLGDLLVSSQTGSGKTAAFMLPALHKLASAERPGRGPRVLVLTPTRELALQVSEASRKYGRHLRQARVVSVVGGTAYPIQNRQLAAPYEILVATPGRLIDQLDRGRIDFGRLEILVLDEADRMLDMGFIEDIERIMAALPKTRQTLLFSATIDERIAKLARTMLKEPKRIEISVAGARHENIEQRLLYADGLSHKTRLLDNILRDVALHQAIVFTSTKRDADALAVQLEGAGFSAAALHGDMKQSQRNRTLTSLRKGGLRVLVATDVAARGIDVQSISHVINFDLPKSPEDYVHRIGRTGRAGNAGIAISLAGRQDGFQVRAIERFTKQSIPVHTISGLEPKTGGASEPSRKPRSGGYGKPFDGPRRSFGNKTGGNAAAPEKRGQRTTQQRYR